MIKLTTVILALVPSVASAAVCVPDFLAFAKSAEAKSGQILQWHGDSPHAGDRYVILSNPTSGEWTAVYVAKTGKACILAAGKGSKPAFGMPISYRDDL